MSFDSEIDRLSQAGSDRLASFMARRLRRLHETNTCESPIERMFLVAFELEMNIGFWADLDIDWRVGQRMALKTVIGATEPDPNVLFTMSPQYQWNNYRIDFALLTVGRPKPIVFIECDGHEFHERTPEQAERDRRRDREVQSDDIAMLRFTGREIYRNPFQCAWEAWEAIGERLDRRRDAA